MRFLLVALLTICSLSSASTCTLQQSFTSKFLITYRIYKTETNGEKQLLSRLDYAANPFRDFSDALRILRDLKEIKVCDEIQIVGTKLN